MEVEDGGYHYLLLLQMRIPGSTTLHVRTTVRAVMCVHDDEMEDGSDSDGSYSDVLVHATLMMSAEAENSQVKHNLPLHLLQHH